MASPLLSVRGLSVALTNRGPDRSLVSDVSFDLHEREVLGIIGESGSGKTVLSRALVNWIKPPLRISAGSVLYRGRDLLQLPPREMQRLHGREIGYVGANPGVALDPTLPVGHQIVE
jgi:peptide/nickel transport system ATP-binding protein